MVKEKIHFLAKRLKWLSFILSTLFSITSIWCYDTVVHLKLSIMFLILIVFFYVIQENTHKNAP